jgi:phage-related protein
LVSGVESAGNGIKNAFNAVVSWFESLPSRFVQFGANMINGLKNGISSVMGTIGSVISNGFNSAISFLTSLPGKALQWGKDFIQGLIDGIKGAIGGVINAVSGVADKIKGFLHFSVPDEGPLTDYETWMPDFMGGLAQGIDKNKSKVTDAIKGLSKDMSVGLNLNKLNPIPAADNIGQGIINNRNNRSINNTNGSIQPQTEDHRVTNNYHIDNINLHEVNNADDMLNDITRFVTTHS